MKTRILKYVKTRFFTLTLAFASVISLGILMQSCSKDEEPVLDEAILNSSELEEFIIAGADFQQSLAAFTASLNKIDLSILESSYNADGRKVLYLPASVASIEIEKKIQSFNEKRDALRKKFPQFTSFRKGISKEYFQHSIENSVNVRTEFLKLGINLSQPKLKNGNEVIYSTYNCGNLSGFLESWVNYGLYVEVYIIYYMDGGIEVIRTEGAQVNNAGDLGFQTQAGTTYLNSRAVSSVGHTHTDEYGGSTPTPPDPNDPNAPHDYWNLPGTSRFIYHNGTFIYY